MTDAETSDAAFVLGLQTKSRFVVVGSGGEAKIQHIVDAARPHVDHEYALCGFDVPRWWRVSQPARYETEAFCEECRAEFEAST